MPAEAAVSVTVKNKRGDLHTLRGDNAVDFATNAVQLLGDESGAAFVESVKDTFRTGAYTVTTAATEPQRSGLVALADEAQAVANVVQAFPGATPQAVTTVGQPLPQPGSVNTERQTAAPVTAAPGEPEPGELREFNGEIKKWIPAGVSKAGKPYKGFWGKP